MAGLKGLRYAPGLTPILGMVLFVCIPSVVSQCNSSTHNCTGMTLTGNSCVRGIPPKYNVEEYKKAKQRSKSNKALNKLLKARERYEKKIAGFLENWAKCKSWKCRYNVSVGEALCFGVKDKPTPKPQYADGKDCFEGETAIYQLPVDEMPDEIPVGGQKAVNDYYKQNCRSGNCFWNMRTGQPVCGINPDNPRIPRLDGEDSAGTYGAHAMLLIVMLGVFLIQ